MFAGSSTSPWTGRSGVRVGNVLELGAVRIRDVIDVHRLRIAHHVIAVLPTTRIDRPSGVVTALMVSEVAKAPDSSGWLHTSHATVDTLTTATPAPAAAGRLALRCDVHSRGPRDVRAVAGPRHVGVGVRASVDVERGVTEEREPAVVALLRSPRVLVRFRHVTLDRSFRKVVLSAEVVLVRHHRGQRVGVPRRRVVGNDHGAEQCGDGAQQRHLPKRRAHLTRRVKNPFRAVNAVREGSSQRGESAGLAVACRCLADQGGEVS